MRIEAKKEMRKTIGSQRQAILAHMLSGKRITPQGAQDLCGCRRLGARIFEIRHKLGYDVKMKLVPNPEGNEYASYWIEK